MIKKIYLYINIIVLLFISNKAFASFSQWEIDPEWAAINEWDMWYPLIEIIFHYIITNVSNLLYLIWIGAFLYIWANLIMARGKPDEFKKAFSNLIYVVVWIVIVSFAWALVKFASGIEF